MDITVSPPNGPSPRGPELTESAGVRTFRFRDKRSWCAGSELNSPFASTAMSDHEIEALKAKLAAAKAAAARRKQEERDRRRAEEEAEKERRRQEDEERRRAEEEKVRELTR